MNRVNIIITNNCNLRCLHCYIDAKSCNEDYKRILEDAKKIIYKLHNDGFRNIMITGGECMIFSYLEELIIYAKSLKMIVTIFTNGMIFNKEIFDLVDYINLSIDGNKATHNYIRQNEKSYDNIIKVLNYLRKIDKKTSVQMTINDLNIKQMEELAELGLNYLNIRNIKLVLTSNMGRAKQNKISSRNSNSKLVLEKLSLLYEKTKYHIQFIPNVISKYDFENYYIKEKLPFALWFDIPNKEYYLFSKELFRDKIDNYNFEIIKAQNKKLFDILYKNKKIIESKDYISLEDTLSELVKGKNDER